MCITIYSQVIPPVLKAPLKIDLSDPKLFLMLILFPHKLVPESSMFDLLSVINLFV